MNDENIITTSAKIFSLDDMEQSFKAGIESVKDLRSPNPEYKLEVDYWKSFKQYLEDKLKIKLQ